MHRHPTCLELIGSILKLSLKFILLKFLDGEYALGYSVIIKSIAHLERVILCKFFFFESDTIYVLDVSICNVFMIFSLRLCGEVT